MSRAVRAALASSACGGKKPPIETVETVDSEKERAAQADAGVVESAPPPPDAAMAPVAGPHNVKMPYGAPPARRRVV